MSDLKPSPHDDRPRLQAGTVLDGVYHIESEIGAGGFGITYRGRDEKLGLPVAIKEYFPAGVGMRDSTMSVHPVTQSQSEMFEWGRQGFIREAQMLASFKHPGIVRVLRYFETNNTAYMVLEFEGGPSLGKWLQRLGRPPTQAEMDKISTGLLDALEAIHAARLIHRDIAPDNVIVRDNGTPVVLDFGAARYELAEATRTHGHSFRTISYAIVKAHYSPFEQRQTDPKSRGPWSDVYSLGATLYRAVTGLVPPDSHDRMGADTDPLVPAERASSGQYRPAFLTAIDRALILRRQDRPQTIAALRDLMQGTGALSQVRTTTGPKPYSAGGAPQSGPTVQTFADIESHRPPAAPVKRSALPRVAAGLAVVALLAGAGWMMLEARTANQRAEVERQQAGVKKQADAAEKTIADAKSAAEEVRKQAEAAMKRVEDERKRAEDDRRRAEETRKAEDEARRRAEAAAREEALRRAEAVAREDAQRRAEAAAREEARQREAEQLEAERRARITFDIRRNTYVDGDGYRIEYGSTAYQCQELCRGDPICVMFEFHPPENKCNLFVDTRPIGTTDDGTLIGFKRW